MDTASQSTAFEYSWIAITGTAVCGVIVVIVVVLIQKKCGGEYSSMIDYDYC